MFNKPVDWQSFVGALNYQEMLGVDEDFIRQWQGYSREADGVRFHALTKTGRSLDVLITMVSTDIFRVRMNPEGLRDCTSDMLVGLPSAATPFEVTEEDERVVITTATLRIVVKRLPWQVSAYALSEGDSAVPFYQQRVNDRKYGPGYEVPPIGYFQKEGHLTNVHEAVAVQPGEAFYGLGEKFTPMNKWGQEHYSWAIDCGNVSSYRSYKNIPFMMSTAGYGIFVHSSFPMVFRMGSVSSISYSFHILDNQLDYFIIYGPTFKQIMSRYTDLTGKTPMPPKWSFGFWISRAGYRSRKQVEEVIREMRERGFPCDVISLDPWWMGEGPWSHYQWDEENFPQPREMLAGLRAQGVRTCLWMHSYLPKSMPIYEEARAQGFLMSKENGEPSSVLEAFTGGEDLGAVDMTNPAAVAWWQSKLQALIDDGVAVFKTDFGEQAPLDSLCYDGRTGMELHNIYPLLYQGAVFELTKRNFGRGLVWGRAAYAGSQRYPVQWGGDCYASLDQISGQMRGLLSYGMSGVPFCSHDVGGFDFTPDAFDSDDFAGGFDLATDGLDEQKSKRIAMDPEVYTRWMQFGCFSSHVRAHGKTHREPWTYGEQAERICKFYLNLRYRLMPYIYSQAVLCTQTSLPMVRPLVLEYQDDPATEQIDLQYLFGESLLVAPVVTRANKRKVYLPKGQWVDYWSKAVYQGGEWVMADAPLAQLPLWVKAGAIVPMGPEMDYINQKPMNPLTVCLYAPQDNGEMIIYDEDQPDITVSYTRRDGTLIVSVSAAPGQVEVELYCVQAKSARSSGKQLSLAAIDGGQKISLDGRDGLTVEMELED